MTTQGALERVREGNVAPYARRLLTGVNAELSDIDRMLVEHVAGWSLDRLGVLERAILRCAVYELRWEPEVPQAVAIDEAVVLAKRFCSAEAGALVNGVLGSVGGRDVRSAREGTPSSEA